MGIRVRKLARELRQSPRDVLQLLKSLGFERYHSAEDMLSDTVAARVRTSARTTHGHRGPAAPDPGRAPRPSHAPAAPDSDLMAQLVPGVKRAPLDQRTAPTRLAEETALGKERAELARTRASLAAQEASLAAQRETLDARDAELAERAQQLDVLAGELEVLRSTHDASVEVFEAARATFVAEQQLRAEISTKPNMIDLLRERGLRGLDEVQRALAALARGHVLGPLVKDLAVADEEGFRRLLSDRLVLVGGEIPEGLAVPAVSVSPDRGELPGADVLARTSKKLAEQWLLFGYRTVVLAGVPLRWHGLLRVLLDPRVTLSFVAALVPPERLGPSEAWFGWSPPLTDQDVDRAFWIPADGSLLLWLQRATDALARTS